MENRPHSVAAFRWVLPCPARAMEGERLDKTPVLSAPAAASVRRPSEPSLATGQEQRGMGWGCGEEMGVSGGQSR